MQSNLVMMRLVFTLCFAYFVNFNLCRCDNDLSTRHTVGVPDILLVLACQVDSIWAVMVVMWLTYIHPLNDSLSGTTQVSQYQKGETNLDFTGARDSE